MGATISHPLQRVGETLPCPLATDWPYLSSCSAFAVPADAASAKGFGELVRAQLAVVAFDRHGHVLDVTGVQVAKVSAMSLQSLTAVYVHCYNTGALICLSRCVVEAPSVLTPPLTETQRNTGSGCRVPVRGASWRAFQPRCPVCKPERVGPHSAERTGAAI